MRRAKPIALLVLVILATVVQAAGRPAPASAQAGQDRLVVFEFLGRLN